MFYFFLGRLVGGRNWWWAGGVELVVVVVMVVWVWEVNWAWEERRVGAGLTNNRVPGQHVGFG